ncbi:phosphoribosylanthranilate isomerase [Pseudodesulfovibrio thermohalotolerans]|uniref:phosphoribosylanthranilate isomerase n=1 Tax=Pseudodesulfovibrio thermohalotolerans TaxID=2880651 RepID=UPI002442BC87|nr:phosphoribosylanthranilate isomerase [Pseudodesulfovibrio thermohalotolerans]WFS63482.1 phosphoribosylanthranilate isomerase [Pseudodesulfovibrio thermohalotolerans]
MTRPLVKVCGMTRMEDVELCVELGVDLLGFIFHEKSPRNADPDFVASVKTGKVSKVGVFVDQTVDEILETMDRCGLHAAQLHGGQDTIFCWKIGPDRVIRAFWPDAYPSPHALAHDLEAYSEVCGHFLLDAGAKGQGGTGKSINLANLQHVEIHTPWFLAGGLGPGNLKAALAADPPGLDFNSGVESAPGIKDETKLREVFRILAELE